MTLRRSDLDRIRSEIRAEAQRVASATLPAIPLFTLNADGTYVSDDPTFAGYTSLDDALATVPDRGAYVARAIVVDTSAGTGDVDAYGNVLDDGPEEDDIVSVPVVRPPRRVSWDDLWPLPGIRPGRDDVTGREYFDRLPDGRIVVGLTGTGERVTVDAVGPYVVESET